MRRPSATGPGGAIQRAKEPGLRNLKIASVVELDLELARVDPFHATRIDRHHGLAFGILAFGKRRNPATAAEMMVDHMLVELIGPDIFARRGQPERRGRNKMQQAA